MANALPASIQKAFAINPPAGSTFLDAEHIVILMQENRSFDHCFGSLHGVRGFNDPRAHILPNQNSVFTQTDALGNVYAPFRLDIKDTKITWMGSLPHSRASQVDANNLGKYDKWLLAKKSGNKAYAGQPLTLGHYTREDLPFNYGMADAFTICDQYFCSAMTSTTPNRSFFWTGNIMHQVDGLQKANIRNEDFSYGNMPWSTFPELLEQSGVSWNFYQNDLSCGGGFTGEERSWLANYGCNLLEFFKAYNVKFSDRYIRNLQKQAEDLPNEITKLQEQDPTDTATSQKTQAAIKAKQEVLDAARIELTKWNKESFDKLTPQQKSLYNRAFIVNRGDENFRSITQLTYMDNGQERNAVVPKGDLLHQFRQDVNAGKLPTVSWLAGPQNFSDHPSAPWYGAWYVSEVLDILTKNPEVWKKTIFITTYDENDGYFDHVPPFSIPDNKLPGTGKVSAGIETEIEHVRLANEVKQGVPEKQAREGAVGLGFRVPMIVASPWSRGGKVCSEVYDHTSTLQFLETFVNKKYKKNIHLSNISEWRRTICGDMTAVFAPYNGDKLPEIPFLNRNKKVEDIFNAKFKQEPAPAKKLSVTDVAAIIAKPAVMELQEKGTRPACAIPYELYTHSALSADKKSVEVHFGAGNIIFGKNASGAPFTASVPVKYNDKISKDEIGRNWYFGVKPGDELTYQWPLDAFDNGQYHLRVHGPNGFYREFVGDSKAPQLSIACHYEQAASGLSGNVVVELSNNEAKPLGITLHDNSYGAANQTQTIPAKGKIKLPLNLAKNHNWYDFSVKISESETFEQRFAGHVETGLISVTDPVMGGLV